MRRIWIFLLLLAGAQSALSALPGDAAFRQKELYNNRQRKLALFEAAKQQREAGIVSRAEALRQERETPPWQSPEGAVPAVKPVSPSAASKPVIDEQKTADFEGAKTSPGSEVVSNAPAVRTKAAVPLRKSKESPAPGITTDVPAVANKAVVSEKSHKWGPGLIALLIIGGGVWWVRTKTKSSPSGR